MFLRTLSYREDLQKRGVQVMAYKEREKSSSLLIMESLMNRSNLSKDERNRYAYLVKGLEGEQILDRRTEMLECDCLVLNDLLLKINGTVVQIDSLLITANGICIYEVKNYEGKYFYEAEKLYKLSTKREVMSPLIQINRSQTLLRQLVEQLGFNVSVNAFVVFVNQQFTLYQAPPQEELLLPTLLNEHFARINGISARLTKNHRRIAEELKSLHMESSIFTDIPNYESEKLKRGITCSQCGVFMDDFTRSWTCTCKCCGHEELISGIVIRHAEEYKRLFPDQKITTSVICKWCGNKLSAKRIWNILHHYYQSKGKGRWTYFE